MASEAEINSRMYKQVGSINPKSAYLKKGTTICEKVVVLLRTESGYSIHRHFHSGNNQKKSTVPAADFQLYIFINEEEPPFQAVLLRLEIVLKQKGKQYEIEVYEIKRTQYSLHVEMKDGFEYELYPAANFVIKSGFLTGEEQQKKALDKIRKDPEKQRNFYHSALGEAHVEFFKKQSGFVNEMVRLGKHWYQNNSETIGNVFDARYFMELVMVHAALQEEKKNYIKCFQRFIDLLINFDDLVVVFADSKYAGHKLQPEIKEQRPVVIDPANPYYNMALDWKTGDKVTIQKSARLTAEKIAKYGVNDPIDKLFKKN